MTRAEIEVSTADLIANEFTRRHPEFAARTGWAGWQKAGAVLTVAVFALALVVAPALLLLLCAAVVVLKCVINTVVSVASLLPERGGDEHVPWHGELPRYTVLVPAYQEHEVIGDLVRHLARLDYPPDRLEVLILVERHDPATTRAVLAADPPPFIRVVELPAGPPQTKPRSCNFGLLLATGDLLVIFDAEDRPEPDQLRRVAARFTDDDALACVQARLAVHNATRNTLTRQFAMEYALRYGMSVPGMARLGAPVPLGGSSNHFRVPALRAAGGWDAWNVTEDADLGMRLGAIGLRTTTIDSATWGESVTRLGPFIRQRTRWFKGFLLTTLVHTRRPPATVRRFGAWGLLTLLGVVGATPVAAMLSPVGVAVSVLAAAGLLWSPVGADAVFGATGALGAAVAVETGLTMLAAVRGRVPGPWIALLSPVYGLLISVAAWRAAVQLVRAPFVWEKTPHGSGGS